MRRRTSNPLSNPEIRRRSPRLVSLRAGVLGLSMGMAVGMAVGMATLLAPALASAAPMLARRAPTTEATSPVGVKLRVTLPYSAVDHVNASHNLVRMLGGAATLEIYELLGVEMGGSWLRGDGEDASFDLFARVGAVPVVLDGRDPDGEGWTVQVGALWGWRWLHREADGDGRVYEEDAHALTATGSLETTHWWAAGVGLNLRATFEFGIPLTRDDAAAWSGSDYALGERTSWYLGGGLMLGLAF